jgi:hypothetical protein
VSGTSGFHRKAVVLLGYFFLHESKAHEHPTTHYLLIDVLEGSLLPARGAASARQTPALSSQGGADIDLYQ